MVTWVLECKAQGNHLYKASFKEDRQRVRLCNLPNYKSNFFFIVACFSFAIFAPMGARVLSQSAGEAPKASNDRAPFTAVSDQSKIEARSI